MKKLIGLTGKSGSGKSTAAKVLKRLGACVIDCDAISHKALFEKEIIDKLRRSFPARVFKGGTVDRKALGRIVFSSKAKLDELNSIVHPWVSSEILKIYKESDCPLVIVDGSELEASGIDKECEHIIVMEATQSARLERILLRDSISRENALLRMNAQKDYSKKAIIIKNDSTKENLEEKIKNLYGTLLE